MRKISQFQITGMTLRGFKCYANTTDIEFGNPTVITGGNGRGKSTIADAIAFAVTGLPFFGERGIDRLHSEINPELFVSLRFTDEEGQHHELTRLRQRSRMTITYDGYDIRQHDLTDMFGEKEVFLSIFNPLYFIEELGDDGKKLLERYLPAVSHEEVLAGLSDNVRASLENESILSPETYLKKQRGEIRELEQTVIYLTGQKDLITSQALDSQQKLDELKERFAALSAEIETLQSKRFAALDISAMQECLVDLSARYDELAKDGPVHIDTSELDDQLENLNRKLGERSSERYVPQYTQAIAESTARVKDLAGKYSRESTLLKGFRAGVVCPTCHRAVTEADLPIVQQALKNSIAEITAEGKERKAQLDELQALEQKTEETFKTFQAEDVEKLNGKIAELTRHREEILSGKDSALESHRTELETLRSQIQALAGDIEYGNLSQVEYDRLNECNEELRVCKAEITAAEKSGAADPTTLEAKIAESQNAITERKKLLANATLYVGKRAELLFSKLKMNKVAISLFEIVKSTGEIKDVFKFTYDGRRYDRLSLSEKIRAGMELAELMKQLTGRNYPVFVDNMESVDDLANVKPTGQIIMAKCVHGAALSVRSMNQVQAQITKAA